MPVSDSASAIEDAAKVSTFEASAASEMARSTASGVGTAAHRALPRGIGRAGRPGVVLSVVPPREAFVLRKFGRSLGVQIPEGQLREGELSAGGEALLCPPGAEAAEAT